MTVNEVFDAMQRFAPLSLAESWDNPGLLVDAGAPADKILVTLDITPAVAEEAKQKGCGVIVSHHPVIFDGLKKLSPADVPYLLVRYGISAVCMHTNLDAAEGGVNDVLAGLVGLRNAEPFADGCGRVGEINETGTAAFAARCAEILHSPVKYADAGKPVRRLALISGAGGSMFEDAVAAGADCLLTGEANHHAALDSVRLGMSLIAATHFTTERPVVEAVANYLRQCFPQAQVLCSEADRDPFTYRMPD